MNKFSRPRRFIFFPLIGVAILFIVSGIVMSLWNCLLPAIFGIKMITYFQAMGILVLSKILFGFGGRRPGGWGRHMCGERHMKEKFANMTPEERDNFKEELKRRATEWHTGHHPGWNQPGESKEQPGEQGS